MNTRKSFMDWVGWQGYEHPSSIDQAKFYNIREKDHVFDVIERVERAFPSNAMLCQDFRGLEKKRYDLMGEVKRDESKSTTEIRAAVGFCAKTDEDKKKQKFRINPELKNRIVKTRFFWNDIKESNPLQLESAYVILPSFLGIAPKEICLVNLNSILLDLKDFHEVFHYEELFNLLEGQLDMRKEELDKMLLDFITTQALYYQTILITH